MLGSNPNVNQTDANDSNQLKDENLTLSPEQTVVQPVIEKTNMNDEKMEVDESARNIEFRKSVEASDSKGLQKREVSSEDSSVKNI